MCDPKHQRETVNSSASRMSFARNETGSCMLLKLAGEKRGAKSPSEVLIHM